MYPFPKALGARRRIPSSGAGPSAHPSGRGTPQTMSNRLGPAWLNQVQSIDVMTTQGRLSRYALLTRRIAALESTLEAEDDDALRARLDALQARARGGTSLNRLLVETFALVREAAKRTIGLRHFDVQMVGGIAIHSRMIAEMETGEGKTLVATLPAVLNALRGKGVYVVTVNDYLAKRDAEWMGQVYTFLGLSVGCIQTGMEDAARRQAYGCDITYGTSKEFGFDFLRDELKRQQLGGDGKRLNFEQAFLARRQANPNAMPVQRSHQFAIVDEADSILIDEARTPLIIGANNQPTQEESAGFYGADEIAATLERGAHFKFDPVERKAELNALGRRKVQAVAGKSAFSTLTVDRLYEYVERALRARIAYLRDRDYVVHDGEIVIVDEFTGRMMPGRQWQDGLHQAIQAKERLKITLETITAARITVQNFFLKFRKLAGMTGTAASARFELRKIYKVGVFRVPTNKPSQRTWLTDRVFSTEDEKFEAVAERIVQLHERGLPVLIGTRSIEKSEKLSALLKQQEIEHQVLNAKNHAIEAEIVALAGQSGKVTVATNMAGRGTDIKLDEGIAEAGGLHVLGTERHESLRVDRQLGGRCARQGDPGRVQFFVSLDDEILESLGEARAKRIRKRFSGRGELTGSAFRRLIFRAQAKKEYSHAKDRKLLMYYEKKRSEMRKNMGLNPWLG